MFFLFITLAGLIVGLGAVTVIDWHGFLARRSEYWTEATTRTHKITKPLIWLGLMLFAFGLTGFHLGEGWSEIATWQIMILIPLVINGFFLSFSVSPYLLRREKEGRSSEVLPESWQRKIQFSFIVSFIGWWVEVLLLARYFS